VAGVPSENIASVVRDGLCTLCGTCLGLCPRGAIRGSWDLDAGLRIEVDDERCTQCGACAAACPGRTVDFPHLTEDFLGRLAWRSRGPLVPQALSPAAEDAVSVPSDLVAWSHFSEAPFVGRSRRLFTGWASDDELRFRGSSGGVATAILAGALETGFIDAAIVTTMDPENPLRTFSYIATDRDGVLAARGSKYTVASPNRLLRRVLEEDGRYALVGLPCHIEGLRKAQTVYKLLRRRVVLAVGLFCGTTCTPRGTLVGIQRMGIDPRDVVSVAYRGDGWPGAFRLLLRSGEQVEAPYPDYFDPWFAAHVPGRCLVCPDGTNELADVAVGDAWLPRFCGPDAAGTSFLIARTPRILRLLESLQPHWLQLEVAKESELVGNQAETRHVKGPGVRGQMWLRSAKGRPLPEFHGLDFSPQPGERWAALSASSTQAFYRAASRLSYRDRVEIVPRGAADGRAQPSKQELGRMQRSGTAQSAYWTRPGLDVRNGHLHVAGRDTLTLAKELALPRYVVDLERIAEQVRALQQAMDRAGLNGVVRLALKAQREPAALRYLRALGSPGSPQAVGVDACSPGEMQLAVDHGWLPEEISYTGTNLSDEDLDEILPHPVHVNVDLLTQIERLGKCAPGRRVGIRINPRIGAAWRDGKTLYSNSRPTKFGIYEEQLPEAVAIAARHGLQISTVHYHIADGVLTDGLAKLEEAAKTAARIVQKLRAMGCPVSEVNTGGGLGVPLRAGDESLNLDAWASILARHLAPLDLIVAVEPGNFLVKESAVLLAKVVTVERRLGTRFVGLNVGWNVMSYRFLYGRPFEVVLCRDPLATASDPVTISGHINEGDDLFAEDYPFPEVREGDIVALLAVGGYAQAMQSHHCLRPPAGSTFFWERQ